MKLPKNEVCAPKAKNSPSLTTVSHLPLAAGVWLCFILFSFFFFTSDLSVFKSGLPEGTGGA